MKSKILKIFLAILTIFSSITTCLFLGAKGSQALSTETVKVYVNEVIKKDDLFYITLDKDLEVESLTYEYVTYSDESKATKVSYLKNKVGGLTRVSTGKYSFNVESETEQEVIGLKVHKVQYKKSSEYFPNHMTEGNFTWNSHNFENVVRLKWLEVTDDKLVEVESGLTCNTFLNHYFGGQQCDDLYFLYFNLNTEELGINFDYIYSLDIEYVTYETRHGLFGALGGKKKYDRTTHEATIVYNEKVRIQNGLRYDKVYSIETLEDGEYKYRTYVDGVKKVDSSVWGLYYEKQYIEDVAMFKITYYKDGEYTTAELLDFPTGVNVHQPGFLTRLIDWLIENINAVFIVGLFLIFRKPIFEIIGAVWKGIKSLFRFLFVPKKKYNKYHY
ncbi:MAG: hypothetical protein E7184_00175 [Erysipelotrichaceae bacterium]|nr:hypothetical protein [Erysipelotrichaceae bacterium]